MNSRSRRAGTEKGLVVAATTADDLFDLCDSDLKRDVFRRLLDLEYEPSRQ